MDIQNDATFVAPEGVYSLTDEIKAPISNSPVASQQPTRLSTITVHYPHHGHKLSSPNVFGNFLGAGKEKARDKESSTELRREPDKTSLSSSDRTEEDPSNPSNSNSTPPESTLHDRDAPITPTTPVTQPFSSSANASGLNRAKSISKPKHNMRTTSSSFVTRVHTIESLNKFLAGKHGDVTYLFYNSARSFFWAEYGSKSKDPIARVTFSSFPTCHAVNGATSCPDRLDIIIGFNTGDLVWFEPITCRYTRLNKGGTITNSHVTGVKWLPGHDRIFITSHLDGTMIVFDKEREDPIIKSFSPRQVVSPPSSPISYNAQGANHSSNHINSHQASNSPATNLWNPLIDIFVSTPSWHQSTQSALTPVLEKEAAQVVSPLKERKDKVGRNPITHWRVSRRAVYDFVFSIDIRYIACISEDGCLRVIDALAEELIDCYASYFGPFTCVAWSPDGRFILTGGQDDLVTVYSPWDRRVVARCQGHSSFITAVAFDGSRCNGRTYRFGSVGEDCRLILWDFSPTALHRPKYAHTYSHSQPIHSNHNHNSPSSTVSLVLRGRGEVQDPSSLHLPLLRTAGENGDPGLLKYHPAPTRGEVSMVQPVLMKTIEPDLLSHLVFLSQAIVTCSKNGHLKIWIRPLVPQHRREVNGVRRRAENMTT